MLRHFYLLGGLTTETLKTLRNTEKMVNDEI